MVRQKFLTVQGKGHSFYFGILSCPTVARRNKDVARRGHAAFSSIVLFAGVVFSVFGLSMSYCTEGAFGADPCLVEKTARAAPYVNRRLAAVPTRIANSFIADIPF
jgi:hypothetical protein